MHEKMEFEYEKLEFRNQVASSQMQLDQAFKLEEMRKSLPVVPNGNINSVVYINILQNEFIPLLIQNGTLGTAIFMQDGARPHTSRDTLLFLQRQFQDRIISNR